MGTFSDTERTVVRIARTRTDATRTEEERLRAEIRAWASWKHDPARFADDLLAAHGLAPLDGPDGDGSHTAPGPVPEPDPDPIEHGTTIGARKHRERNDPLCDACWGAIRTADRERKAASRARKPVTS